jgi:hypothetical protein
MQQSKAVRMVMPTAIVGIQASAMVMAVVMVLVVAAEVALEVVGGSCV